MTHDSCEDSGQCIAAATNDHASVSTIIAALQLELFDIHAVADQFITLLQQLPFTSNQ